MGLDQSEVFFSKVSCCISFLIDLNSKLFFQRGARCRSSAIGGRGSEVRWTQKGGPWKSWTQCKLYDKIIFDHELRSNHGLKNCSVVVVLLVGD